MAGFHVGDTCIEELWVESFVLVVTWLKDLLKNFKCEPLLGGLDENGGELS
jgi:hypothetical protein